MILRIVLVMLSLGALASAAQGVDEFQASRKSAKKLADETEAAKNWEHFKDITVDPGKSYTIDSAFDYSLAASVAVTLRMASDSLGTVEFLTLQAYWSVPEAELFAATDSKLGKSFPYLNTGGVVFPVYGSQFRLILRNTGETTMKIQQLVILCRWTG